MFSFFRGRKRERLAREKKRENDIKNETLVGVRKIGKEIGVEERERTTER